MQGVYDVVIIGGGIGGLIAGNYLAQQGLHTIILEAQDHAGGYVHSFQCQGFTFDVGLTSFGSNGIVFAILQELGLGQLRFRRVKRSLISDQIQARVDGSWRKLQQQLVQVYPEEAEQIEKYFQWLQMTSHGFRSLFQSHIFLEEWREGLGDLVQLPLKEFAFCKFLWQERQTTNRELHRRYFQNTRLIDFLDQIGYPVMSGVVTAGMWYSFKSDYWYPIGGMGKFRDQLVAKYIQSGGEIQYQARVAKLVLKDQKGEILPRVTGVLLTNGQELTGQRVISNLSPQTTYLDLLGEKWVEPALATQLKLSSTSESICSLYLGLSGKGFSASKFPLDASHYTFYLPNEMGQPQKFALYILTQEDLSLAPDGEVVILHCFADYGEWEPYRSRDHGTYQTEAYLGKKEEQMERMLKLARMVIPDLDQRLVVKEGATPLTLERYTGNPKGATAGWSWNPKKQTGFSWQQANQIPGLDLVGCWLIKPGGVPTSMLTGRWVAKKIIHNFR